MTTALRPRTPWEGVDLGVVMLRAWWRPAYGAAACAILPVAFLAHLLVDSRLLALVIVWWLKPLYDRVVLHVLANALFGATPRLRETLARTASLVRTSGLPGALSVRRLDPARSFNLPVRQLEGQSGSRARERQRLLGRRMAAQTWALLYCCIAFEIVVLASLAAFVDLAIPASLRTDFGLTSLFAVLGAEDRGWIVSALVVAAILAIEPLYVACGFALYLNRRTSLEAWDLELRFRRLQAQARTPRARPAVLLAGIALCASMLAPEPAYAASQTSREIIREVLDAPEFQQDRPRKVWQWRRRDGAEARSGESSYLDLPTWLGDFSAAAAQLLRLVAYAALAAGVLLAARFLLRQLAAGAWHWPRRKAKAHPPEAVLGFDVRPGALPADLARLAAAAAEADPRLALSLLYRGALVSLIHRSQLGIEQGDTEADCLRRVQASQPAEIATYFSRLVAAWSRTAYGHEPPSPAQVAELCALWPQHFAPGASA